MLTIMIILGSVWANIAWGRYCVGPEGDRGAGDLADLWRYLRPGRRRLAGRRAAWLLVLVAAIVFTIWQSLLHALYA